MTYYASVDVRTLPVGSVTIGKSGGGSVGVMPRLLNQLNGYGTASYVFNPVMSNAWGGFDLAGSQHLRKLTPYTFFGAYTTAVQAAATLLGWPDPNTLTITYDNVTRRAAFRYPTGITSISFGDPVLRRLFGFSSSFSGSATTIIGDELPSYIIVPSQDGASAASVVMEADAVGSLAYSAAGRTFGIARSQAPMRRTWVQQYESRAKTFARFADGAPDEFTYEHLYESSRAGLPFAVFDGFGQAAYSGYCLDIDEDAYHPIPAVAGSYDQFHIPFRTLALAHTELLVTDGDGLTFEGEDLFF